MKQIRPSLRTYRAHVYRELFGYSLSLKPVVDRNGQHYAVLRTIQYKLFWVICYTAAYILTLIPGWPFGLIPFFALPVLYLFVAPFQYFFARFVKLDADYVTDDMCEKALKSNRPSFSAYLKFVYIPRRERLALLIEEDGNRYYRIPRTIYPENAMITVLSMATFRAGALMGPGMLLLLLLVFIGLYLLLAPLSLFIWRFEKAEEPEFSLSEDPGPSPVSYKVANGILIAVAVAVLVLTLVFLFDWRMSEKTSIDKPPTIGEVYNSALVYSSEQFGNADLVDFCFEFKGIDAFRSGEPAYFYLVFQDAPGLRPEPNTTFSFYSYQDDIDIRAYYEEYQYIEPALNAALVTDLREILDILESDQGGIFTSDISLIRISPVDRSVFRVFNRNECVVEIRYGEHNTQKYIVNIDNRTVRPT